MTVHQLACARIVSGQNFANRKVPEAGLVLLLDEPFERDESHT